MLLLVQYGIMPLRGLNRFLILEAINSYDLNNENPFSYILNKKLIENQY